MLTQLYSSLTESVDRRVGWAKLPWPLGLFVVLGLRFRLRAKNLYDSGRGVLDLPPAGDEWHVDHLTARTIDGTYNDLQEPLMGALGSRFGRNVPLTATRSPRTPPTTSIGWPRPIEGQRRLADWPGNESQYLELSCGETVQLSGRIAARVASLVSRRCRSTRHD
jgi:hypothetical protein